jgi:hypothetical protein
MPTGDARETPEGALALQGVALFAFIPLVLFLYLAQPFGPGASLALGLAIMIGHSFVAAPWMARHARQRCLWCGRATTASASVLEVGSGRVTRRVRACAGAHEGRIRRFLAFTVRFRVALAIGIFVPLILLLVSMFADSIGRPLIARAWAARQFRVVVALTVVTASLVYPRTAPLPGRLRSVFPLHNLFLLGIRNTLWVFRVVGAWWLISGAW